MTDRLVKDEISILSYDRHGCYIPDPALEKPNIGKKSLSGCEQPCNVIYLFRKMLLAYSKMVETGANEAACCSSVRCPWCRPPW